MKIACDLCGGRLTVDPGGRTASCEECGMPHALARVREKIRLAMEDTFTEDLSAKLPFSDEPPLPDDALKNMPDYSELPFPMDTVVRRPDGKPVLISSNPLFPPPDAEPPVKPKKKSTRKKTQAKEPTIHRFVFWIFSKSHFRGNNRTITGKVASGTVCVGDEVMEDDTPFYHTCTTYKIAGIKINGQSVQKAYAGQQPVELIFEHVDSRSAFRHCDRLFGREMLEDAPAVDAQSWKGSLEDYFAEILEKFFPEYDVLRDTAVGGMDESCRPISFALVDENGPALAIIFCTGYDYRRREVEDTVRACEKAHIPVQRYFREYPNNAAFIYKRIKDELRK